MIVGPTKLPPRARRSLAMARDSSLSAGMSARLFSPCLDRPAADEAPEMAGEAPLFGQVEIDAGERDRRVDLGAIAHDAGVEHQRLLLRRVPAGDPFRLEAVEGGAERRALAQNRDPRESGLERVEDEFFEQGAVVVFGRSPFLVMIGEIERIGAGPRAALQSVGAEYGRQIARRFIARRLFSLGHGLLMNVDPAALMPLAGPPGKVRTAFLSCPRGSAPRPASAGFRRRWRRG